MIRSNNLAAPRTSAAPLFVVFACGVVVGLVSFSKPNLMVQHARTSVGISRVGGSSYSGGATCKQSGVGTPWPGTTPMELPSKETYDRLQGDHTLPERKQEVLAEFEAAPWLLPPRTKALSYAGVDELDKLLQLRSMPQGKYSKTITLMTYAAGRFDILMQNTIYTMVKFGGVRNYIVGTWTKHDLEACADLNLPCADVSAFLPEPMDHSPDAGEFGSHDYLACGGDPLCASGCHVAARHVICWLRPAIIKYLLKKGFAVLNTDSDVVFTVKPVWQSYLAYLEAGSADAAFQAEYSSVNGGNYVVLPTPAAIKLFEAWSAKALKSIKAGQHDQQGLDQLMEHSLRRCTWSSKSCRRLRREMDEAKESGKLALIRAFQPGFYMYSDDVCTLSRPEEAPLFDTCDWSMLFLHPICAFDDIKLAIFKQQQLWFMDDDYCLEHSGQGSKVKVCQPLRWRVPDLELHLYCCPSYGLALEHERPLVKMLSRQLPPAQSSMGDSGPIGAAMADGGKGGPAQNAAATAFGKEDSGLAEEGSAPDAAEAATVSEGEAAAAADGSDTLVHERTGAGDKKPAEQLDHKGRQKPAGQAADEDGGRAAAQAAGDDGKLASMWESEQQEGKEAPLPDAGGEEPAEDPVAVAKKAAEAARSAAADAAEAAKQAAKEAAQAVAKEAAAKEAAAAGSGLDGT